LTVDSSQLPTTDQQSEINNKKPRIRPLLLGHRGARKYAPENTFAAFDLALQHGCDGFEFDVRLTLDQQSVLLHDPRVKRRAIDVHSLAALTVLLAPNAPASLSGVVERYSGRCFLDIELKVQGLVQQAAELVRRFRPQHVVASFLPEVVQELKACRIPELVVGLNVRNRPQLRRFSALDPDVLIAHHVMVSRSLVDDMHAASKKIFAWTVNSQREMLRLAEWGVDAIISDRTRLLCDTLGR
jgi:glycerophosphoryl diester phosphodiesterase